VRKLPGCCRARTPPDLAGSWRAPCSPAAVRKANSDWDGFWWDFARM
jgi:hypothetical protein